jgi:sugar/nucleoside kinase (ribokinase family)
LTSCDLLVLAELNLDVIVECGSADITFGQIETAVEGATLTLGSSGAIAAAAAAAQGCRVAIAGLVGADPTGAMVIDRLIDLGVDVRAVIRREDLRTGLSVVLNRPDGDRALLTYPGAMTAFTSDLVDRDLLAATRHVHVSSPFLQTGLQPGLAQLLLDARTSGATTSVDPGWAPAEDWSPVLALLPLIDHLLPNAAECRELVPDSLDPLDAARILARHGPTVAVKLGADGGALASTGLEIRAAGTPVVPTDTTGAGDNFDAGYLVALLEGVGPAEALARGVAAGAIAVTGLGGTGRMGSRSEVLAGAARVLITSASTVEGNR